MSDGPALGILHSGQGNGLHLNFRQGCYMRVSCSVNRNRLRSSVVLSSLTQACSHGLLNHIPPTEGKCYCLACVGRFTHSGVDAGLSLTHINNYTFYVTLATQTTRLILSIAHAPQQLIRSPCHFAFGRLLAKNTGVSFSCHRSKASATVLLVLTASLTAGSTPGFFGLTWVYILTYAVVTSHHLLQPAAPTSTNCTNELHRLSLLLTVISYIITYNTYFSFQQHLSASPLSIATYIVHHLDPSLPAELFQKYR